MRVKREVTPKGDVLHTCLPGKTPVTDSLLKKLFRIIRHEADKRFKFSWADFNPNISSDYRNSDSLLSELRGILKNDPYFEDKKIVGYRPNPNGSTAIGIIDVEEEVILNGKPVTRIVPHYVKVLLNERLVIKSMVARAVKEGHIDPENADYVINNLECKFALNDYGNIIFQNMNKHGVKTGHITLHYAPRRDNSYLCVSRDLSFPMVEREDREYSHTLFDRSTDYLNTTYRPVLRSNASFATYDYLFGLEDLITEYNVGVRRTIKKDKNGKKVVKVNAAVVDTWHYNYEDPIFNVDGTLRFWGDWMQDKRAGGLDFKVPQNEAKKDLLKREFLDNIFKKILVYKPKNKSNDLSAGETKEVFLWEDLDRSIFELKKQIDYLHSKKGAPMTWSKLKYDIQEFRRIIFENTFTMLRELFMTLNQTTSDLVPDIVERDDYLNKLTDIANAFEAYDRYSLDQIMAKLELEQQELEKKAALTQEAKRYQEKESTVPVRQYKDERREYGAPEKESTAPVRQYKDERREYGAPEKESTAPVRQYKDERREYVAPEKESTAPVRQYKAGRREYGAPEKESTAPVRQYKAGRREYGAPEKESTAPVRQYKAGRREYGAPEKESTAPVRQYKAGRREYGAPEKESTAPVRQYKAGRREYGAPEKESTAPVRQYKAGRREYGAREKESTAPVRQYKAGRREYGAPEKESTAPVRQYNGQRRQYGHPVKKYNVPLIKFSSIVKDENFREDNIENVMSTRVVSNITMESEATRLGANAQTSAGRVFSTPKKDVRVREDIQKKQQVEPKEDTIEASRIRQDKLHDVRQQELELKAELKRVEEILLELDKSTKLDKVFFREDSTYLKFQDDKKFLINEIKRLQNVDYSKIAPEGKVKRDKQLADKRYTKPTLGKYNKLPPLEKTSLVSNIKILDKLQEPLNNSNNSNGESANSNGSKRAKAIAYGKKVSKFRRRAAQQKSEILLTDRARRGLDSTLYEEKVGAERAKSLPTSKSYVKETVKLPRLLTPKDNKIEVAERGKSRASNSRYAAGTVKLPRLFSAKESKDAPMLGKTVEFMPPKTPVRLGIDSRSSEEEIFV